MLDDWCIEFASRPRIESDFQNQNSFEIRLVCIDRNLKSAEEEIKFKMSTIVNGIVWSFCTQECVRRNQSKPSEAVVANVRKCSDCVSKNLDLVCFFSSGPLPISEPRSVVPLSGTYRTIGPHLQVTATRSTPRRVNNDGFFNYVRVRYFHAKPNITNMSSIAAVMIISIALLVKGSSVRRQWISMVQMRVVEMLKPASRQISLLIERYQVFSEDVVERSC